VFWVVGGVSVATKGVVVDGGVDVVVKTGVDVVREVDVSVAT